MIFFNFPRVSLIFYYETGIMDSEEQIRTEPKCDVTFKISDTLSHNFYTLYDFPKLPKFSLFCDPFEERYFGFHIRIKAGSEIKLKLEIKD